jgi:hypothetical protein
MTSHIRAVVGPGLQLDIVQACHGRRREGDEYMNRKR